MSHARHRYSHLLYARNWAFIPADAQAKLRGTVIFAAGVGLASNVVTLACRAGFTRFILADGDRVEVSNLNRQAFGVKQIGKNKAKATAKLLRAIHPDVEVEILPYELDERTYRDPLARADIVVNSLDFDQEVMLLLNSAAQALNKPVLQPLNLGWGGAVLTFLPTSPSLAEFLGLPPDGADVPAQVKARLIREVVARMPGGLPPYLEPIFAEFQSAGDSWAADPQIGPAAWLTSCMVVRAAIALTLGEPVKAVPQIAHCDLRTVMDPVLGPILDPALAPEPIG